MAEEHLHDDQLVALAVDDVDEPQRSRLLQHLSGCGRCRTEYDKLASPFEQTLAAAPAMEPPPGFDARVFAALGLGDRVAAPAVVSRQVRPVAASRPSSWRRVIAAAAVGIAVGAGGVGLWTAIDEPAPAAGAVSFLATPDGRQVGTVTPTLEAGNPALVVTVFGGKVGMEYLCELRLESGTRVEVATWRIGSEQPHAWIVPTSEPVAEVLLVAEAGDGPVWSSAVM